MSAARLKSKLQRRFQALFALQTQSPANYGARDIFCLNAGFAAPTK
jgi:hypothetical protein